jgi:hypothetical protein
MTEESSRPNRRRPFFIPRGLLLAHVGEDESRIQYCRATVATGENSSGLKQYPSVGGVGVTEVGKVGHGLLGIKRTKFRLSFRPEPILFFISRADVMRMMAGMNLGVQYYRAPFPEQKYWEDDFKRIRDSGLNTVQLWVLWAWVESKPGQFVYDDYDKLMELADRNGLG